MAPFQPADLMVRPTGLERSRREILQAGSEWGQSGVGVNSESTRSQLGVRSESTPTPACHVWPPSLVLKVRPSAVVTVADWASVARTAIRPAASGNATRRQERPSVDRRTVPA